MVVGCFGGSEGRVCWQVCTLAGQRTGHGGPGKVISVDFSPDGERIVSASDDNLVKIWVNEARDEVRAPSSFAPVGFTDYSQADVVCV